MDHGWRRQTCDIIQIMAAGGLALSFSPSLSISVIHPPPSLQLILTSRWNVDHSGKYAPTSSSEFVISLITGCHLSIDTMSGGMGLLYLWGLEVGCGNHRPVHLLLPENRVWLGVCVRVWETERSQTNMLVWVCGMWLCVRISQGNQFDPPQELKRNSLKRFLYHSC